MEDKEFLLTIVGTQADEEEKDEVELFTTGNFYRTDHSWCIAYDESEATGFEGNRTVVELEDDLGRVTMNRLGNTASQLIIEKGVRHQCTYNTGYGSMIIGVSGDYIHSSLTEKGGELSFGYSLDVNTSLVSENTVTITVRQPEN
ncbi:MAG: DUF1934 domain-containing protein [Oscillospiraceae bacterium]|jgi:uncharacterized beta-barrel protein YwiB (DUF1934 family)|nr:DUF1934 domain-containing protein [Oscillospiraceae bacterium]